MIAKALEVRDKATFIPVLAVQMVSLDGWEFGLEDLNEQYMRQHYLLRRCGYSTESPFAVLLTRLDGAGKACVDPYDWGDRTFKVAHHYIDEHFDELADGDVIDVEFILGETKGPKVSERITAPL